MHRDPLPVDVGAALPAARERHQALRELITATYADLTKRSYGLAALKLERALELAAAPEWYLAPDEAALDRLVAVASVAAELCGRLQLRAQEQAAAVLRAAVDLRLRLHLGER